jgi:hypothetical protein
MNRPAMCEPTRHQQAAIRFLAFSLVLTLFVILSSGCATPSAPPAMLASRLTPAWTAAAQNVRSGDRTIYYHGRAHGTKATAGRDWYGSVSGEILALDPGMAMVIPSGTLTLTPGGGIKIVGQHQIVTSDAPAWKHLLIP